MTRDDFKNKPELQELVRILKRRRFDGQKHQAQLALARLIGSFPDHEKSSARYDLVCTVIAVGSWIGGTVAVWWLR